MLPTAHWLKGPKVKSQKCRAPDVLIVAGLSSKVQMQSKCKAPNVCHLNVGHFSQQAVDSTFKYALSFLNFIDSFKKKAKQTEKIPWCPC